MWIGLLIQPSEMCGWMYLFLLAPALSNSCCCGKAEPLHTRAARRRATQGATQCHCCEVSAAVANAGSTASFTYDTAARSETTRVAADSSGTRGNTLRVSCVSCARQTADGRRQTADGRRQTPHTAAQPAEGGCLKGKGLLEALKRVSYTLHRGTPARALTMLCHDGVDGGWDEGEG